MKQRKSKRSQKKMRGGVQLVTADTTLGGLQLPQGNQFLSMKSMLGSPLYAPGGMKGGSALYPGSVGQPMLDGSMAQAAGTAVLDKVIAEALQAGGRKRKSSRKSKKDKKSKKTQRKSQRKSKKSSKKSQRKTQRKSKKSQRKSQRKSKKSQRKSRKQRGGVMDVSDSTKMLLESSLMQKAGLNQEWRSIESGNVL